MHKKYMVINKTEIFIWLTNYQCLNVWDEFLLRLKFSKLLILSLKCIFAIFISILMFVWSNLLYVAYNWIDVDWNRIIEVYFHKLMDVSGLLYK